VYFVIVFAITTLGGAALLALAIWPGLLGDVVFGFPFLLLSLPALGIWFLVLVGLGLLDLVGGWKPNNRRRWGLWSAAIMFVMLALLWLNVPQRVAFALSFSKLQPLANRGPTERFFEKHGEIQAGPYRIDVYARDERGGVFFRTRTGPDGIGPDTVSYGFAFRPNREGTPFGNAHYQRRHLFREWYAFSASDDW
jgi:hypothetical protein